MAGREPLAGVVRETANGPATGQGRRSTEEGTLLLNATTSLARPVAFKHSIRS
jgi:hypothetical protein